jgi:starch phosphorylase
MLRTKVMPMQTERMVAYFSMEIALEAGLPTYSGGLGVLAGDTIRSAADLKVPMVAITLLHRKGYFYQRLDASGWQTEEPAEWVVADFLQEMPPRVTVQLEGRPVKIRAWKYEVKGISGSTVPVYLLDCDLPENTEWDRKLTHYLYGGDAWYRLCQETVLGIGGVRMLRALGCNSLTRFHMNKGHASLLTVELLYEQARKAGRKTIVAEDLEAVRQQCIFTTHTPVPAGHDQFPVEMVQRLMGQRDIHLDLSNVLVASFANHVVRRGDGSAVGENPIGGADMLNMTYLALNLSHYVNGVAKKHAEVSRLMFAEYQVDAITNGVHAATWTSPSFQALFDRHIAGWREDNFSLRYALGIASPEVWEAHCAAKRELVQYVNRETNAGLDADVLTLGFARRTATYKRADLPFRDLDRLRGIAAKAGRLQIIYAGKAHPQDQAGKQLIQRIFQARDALRNDIRVCYLANYDMDLARRLLAGVDVWLNTPEPPMEASGTSGMKAALNGVPSLSVLDGWWIEGCIEGVTGWALGERCDITTNPGDRAACDAVSLYDKLERVVIPLFYKDRERFLDVMRHAIALNGSFFNTQRMVQQYVLRAYFE